MNDDADRKANIVRAWQEAVSDPCLVEERGPDDIGISKWSLGSAVCFIESIRADAPEIAHVTTQWRVLANLTGRCPRCGAVSSIEHERLLHESGCEVSEGLPDEYFVNPDASAFLHAMMRAARRTR